MWCMAALSPGGGFTAFEGFDYGDNLSFRECLVLGSARYFFCEKVEHNAMVQGRIGMCEGVSRV